MVVGEFTVEAEMLKFAKVAPAGTVIEDGTAARLGAELDSVTEAPPAGAGAPRITAFDTVAPPPTIAEGESATVRDCAVKGVFSTFAERYAVVQESAHGSSVKSVAIDCDHGAELICR